MRDACNVVCPADCVMGGWSALSECDRSCGGGVQTRTREILYTSVTRARDRLHIMGDSGALGRMISNPRRTVFSTVSEDDSVPEEWHPPTAMGEEEMEVW